MLQTVEFYSALLYREVLQHAQFELAFLFGLCILWWIKRQTAERLLSPSLSKPVFTPSSRFVKQEEEDIRPVYADKNRKGFLFDAARRSKMDIVHRIMDSMQEHKSLPPDILGSVLRVLMARKMTMECLELYERYPMDDLAVHRIILACCVEERQTDQAMEMFEKIGDRANMRDWNTLMRMTRYAHFGCDKAFEILERMKKSSVAPSITIFQFVFQTCIQHSELEKGEQLLPYLGGDVVYYNTIIRAYSELNRLEDSKRIFKRIKELELKPNPVTYGTMLHACVQANELTLAKEIVQEMRTDGVELNIVHQTTLIKGLCRQRLMNDAVAMFEEMENPDLVTFSTLIKALVDVQRLDEAYKLTDRLENANVQLDEIVYNSLLLGCAHTGDVKLARATFERMQSHGVKPSAATVSTLLKLYAKLKMWDESVLALQSLDKYEIGPEPRLFRQVILGLCRYRSGRRVLEVYDLFQSYMAKSAEKRIPKDTNGEILAACMHFNLFGTATTLIHIFIETNQLVPTTDLNRAADVLKRQRHQSEENSSSGPTTPTTEVLFEISLLRRRSQLDDETRETQQWK